MSKVSYANLKLKVNDAAASFEENGYTVEVKQYLPVEEKMGLIQDIIDSSSMLDNNNYYNEGSLNVYMVLNIMYHYTNINFTDKQKENPLKLYDAIVSSGLWDDVCQCMNKSEIKFIENITYHTIDNIYKYKNSVYGVLDAMNTDYKDLNFNVSNLEQSIANRDNVEFLNSVMEKLG